MTRGYLFRLLIWATLVTGFFAVAILWSTRTVPAMVERMQAEAPSAPAARNAPSPESFPGLTRYVLRPLGWLRDNFVFVVEVIFLILVARGTFGAALGVPDLVHTESATVRFVNGLVMGMTVGNCLFVAFVTDVESVPWKLDQTPTLFPVDPAMGRPGESDLVRIAGQFMLIVWVPVLVLMGINRPSGTPWISLGLSASVVVSIGLVLFGWATLTSMQAADWRAWFAFTPGAADGRIPAAGYVAHVIATCFTVLPLILIVLLTLSALVGYPGSPVWVVCLCLWFFNATYGFISFHFNGLQFVMLAFFLAIVFISNSRHSYKLSLPGLDPEYAAARSGHATPLAVTVSPVGARPVPLLDAETVLAGFRERWERDHGLGQKPKLLVVCTSGGGIRAGVWTAAVFAELEQRLGPAFQRHLRLITGASGGMVEAALFAGRQLRPLRDRLSDADVLATDSLWPTWQGLFFRDAPAAITPFYRPWDRAKSLEASWIRNSPTSNNPKLSPLASTFAEMIDLERRGLAPSCIFSPLMVEDGRQLLISNLDLHELAVEAAPTLGTTMDGRPFADRQRISQPGVEFFRLFPDAHNRFRLSTAARLSATFPYVSPAVSLPTDPPRRLVDAGFFDNYGVGLAGGWLLRHRKLVREHCSGVAILEVRAFPLEAEKTGLPEGGVMQRGDLISTVFSGLSAPAEALGVVRAAGAYYRNDHLLGLLDDEFNDNAETPFFVRVPLECPGDGSMSWAISRRDRDMIVHEAKAREAEITGLQAWFGNGGGSS
jgi:Patatin-like phospholipase